MVENGSSGGGLTLPPGESHDEFLELCALATTNWLSARERKRLEEHLALCSACREAMNQYQALVADDIPAALLDTPEAAASSEPGWSLSEAEASFFARLERETSIPADQGSREIPPAPAARGLSSVPADSLWRHMWWQYAAGLLLAAALGFSVYRSGIERGAESAHNAASAPAQRSDSEHPPQPAAATDQDAAARRRQDARLAALNGEVAKQSAAIARLSAERAKLLQSVSSAEADRDNLAMARDNLTRQLEAAEAQLRDVQQRLEASGAQNAADEVKLVALNRQIEDLNAGLEQKNQELAREGELLDHDRDIRELMGSRNLYIAEVYDVARSGQTQRPFGRVFYTKGKSLIFYAYDLDQQPGLRNAATFQAWGRRGPDQSHAVNLGIFYADNTAKKRWVLKAENPKTLSDIDAVFVTVEPHGGSNHPSGKPLLFAYLRIEPNHP